MVGQQLGRFVIERCIGDGGMGSVYMGVDSSQGDRVAIKVLRPELARDAEMVERFLREGRAAGRIEHPGIVKILDSGLTEKGRPYLVMEYLEGQPLSAYLAEHGRLPVVEVLRIGQELAAALVAAHAKQVIHRDLKPENIFRSTSASSAEPPHIKILDFGIALVEQPRDRKRLTRAGEFLGTPCYMAPEVVIDPRAASVSSDAYAFGVILYQMLVGEPPFTADSPSAILFKQVSEMPARLEERAPGTPPALCALVHRLLSKNPAERPTLNEAFWLLLGMERSLPAAAPSSMSSQRLWRRSWVQRSILWIAPSLFICAVAAGLTSPPSRRVVVATTPVTPQAPAAPVAASVTPAVEAPAVETPLDPEVAATPESTVDRPSRPALPLRLATDQPDVSFLRPKAPILTTDSPLQSPPENSASPSPLDAAKRAFYQTRYDEAIAGARASIKTHPYEAWQLIGRAGCMKRDGELVKDALRRLDPARMSLVVGTCRANKFNLQDE